MKILAFIPHYNHPNTIAQVAHALRQFDLDVLIVDDGSRSDCRPVLDALAQEEGINVIYRSSNGGKGAACKTGIQAANEQGYSHILQVDADAQHNLDDTPRFIQAALNNPQAIICGWPQYGSDAPKSRLYGRKITDFWNAIHTWSLDIKDGMCGFRLYPIAPTFAVIREENIGNRMDFDTEIIVHLHWRKVPMIWLKTLVRYEAGGVSHFHALHDNIRISKMHTRLFFGMLRRKLGGKK